VVVPNSFLPVEDAILAGRVVQVQCSDVDASYGGGEAREWSTLPRGRVTDAESAVREGDQ
jgi:hypothetical protein